MGEHTPGPWIAEPADMFGDHNIVLAEGDDWRAIAAVVSNMRPEQEVAANALLTAAAPDLLEAALMMRHLRNGTEMTYEDAYDSMFKSGGRDAWKTLDAAIAKATGASS